MVERKLPKLEVGVRFSSSAPPRTAGSVAVLVLGIGSDLALPDDLENRVQSELARLLPSWRVAVGEIPDELAAAPPVVRVEVWFGDHLEEVTPEVVLHAPGAPCTVPKAITVFGVTTSGSRAPSRSTTWST